MRRTDRRLAGEVLFLVLCYLVPVLIPAVNVHGWRGGWSPPARFLAPVAPFLVLSIWFAVVTLRPRLTVWLLMGVQIVLNALFWGQPKLLWEDGDSVSKLYTLLGGSHRVLAEVWPTFTGGLNTGLLIAVVALVAWAALSTGLLAFTLRGTSPRVA
jgi:hypothetical protein